MSFENEGLPASWKEIKAASRRLVGREPAEEYEAEKRRVREYLSRTDCDDARDKEYIAVPGYN